TLAPLACRLLFHAATASEWHDAQATAFGFASCGIVAASAWQSMQPRGEWTEPANFFASTVSWQARQSSLVVWACAVSAANKKRTAMMICLRMTAPLPQ